MPFLHGILLSWLAPVLFAGVPDPGLLVEIDLERFELHVVDLGAWTPGPTFAVAIGSPTHPTPRGEFRPIRVIRNPSWVPGPWARSLGAEPAPPSSDGPLGVGKIPLGGNGIQIHGGAHPLELGKPVSLGCVRMLDQGWYALVEWLEDRRALRPWQRQPAGEVESGFRRPLRVVVR